MKNGLEGDQLLSICESLAVMHMYTFPTSIEGNSIQKPEKLFLLAINRHRVDEVTDVQFNESLQKRLVLIDGEEDSWMQTADKDEDDFLEDDITYDKTEKRGPGRPPGSINKINVISNPLKMELRSKSTERTAMLAAADPLTEEEALEGANAEKWKEAMLEEISALHMNNTWILTDLPADRKTIQYGEVSKYKARLVAKGYIRYESVRTLLAIAADEDLEILQFDVKTAFLHGKIDELIFMEQPPCFNDGSGRVCKLQRALYGLKQAPRAWNKRLNDFLLTLNLQRAEADPCIYVSAPGAECRIILRLYVDDGLFCCSNLTVLKELQEQGVVSVEYIPSDKQPADMLTKALSSPRHLKCRQMLRMNVDPVGSEGVLK
ncbi:Retrovirus-related Pol polyprotein from transposon TNT 1-94 [Trichinella britovi]|uniref:Retrovirus-related Pol polyprotein from transposon TNT 1-94 n=1 Tax=Trichinella britovi TaxID=45882 RepID=A0A0V1CDL4_TRIBR|nr:Retrovirus-related Pol polyprotein from transposon TNT 1-94 [Trichinella britovi]